MVASKLVGVVIAATGLNLGVAHSQTVTTMNGRLVPYIPKVLPLRAGGPLQGNSRPSVSANATSGASQPANDCPTFLKTNPDVLRTVNDYVQGSTIDPNMSASQTVYFIATTITQKITQFVRGDYFKKHESLYYGCLGGISRSDIAAAWPTLSAVIAEKEKREAAETETQRRAKEAQAEQFEKAKRQAATDALPANRLQRAYRLYIALRRCFEAREGYAAVYVNEEQAQKARKWVLGIEAALRKEDPSINSDAVWAQANKPETRTPTSELGAIIQFADQVTLQQLSSSDWNDDAESFCGRSFDALNQFHLSIDPDAKTLKKDF